MSSLPNGVFDGDYETGMREIRQASEKTQPEKFKDKARELGVDGDEKSFADKLKRIVRQNPKKDKGPDK